MTQLGIGKKAPDFKLVNQHENEVSLSDFHGKKVLVYFYPKADTPGCTKQACSVRDSMNELKKHKITVLGISPDAPSKQLKFDSKNDLGFQLLSDPDNKVAKSWGAWGKKSMYGKEYEGIIRSCFLLDEQGKILTVCYKVKPEETVPKVLEALSTSKV